MTKIEKIIEAIIIDLEGTETVIKQSDELYMEFETHLDRKWIVCRNRKNGIELYMINPLFVKFIQFIEEKTNG